MRMRADLIERVESMEFARATGPRGRDNCIVGRSERPATLARVRELNDNEERS